MNSQEIATEVTKLLSNDLTMNGYSKFELMNIICENHAISLESFESQWGEVRNKLRSGGEIRSLGRGRKHIHWIHAKFYPEDSMNQLISKCRIKNIPFNAIEQYLPFSFNSDMCFHSNGHINIRGLMHGDGKSLPTFRVRCPELFIDRLDDFLTMDEYNRINLIMNNAEKISLENNRLGLLSHAETRSQAITALMSLLLLDDDVSPLSSPITRH